jgi:hypothetical protein
MIKSFRLATVALFFAALFSSCNEEGSLGLDLLPNVDGVGVFRLDTFSVVTYTVDEDSVESQFPSRKAFGVINDPVFGRAEAISYFQTLLTTENVDLGQNVTADSLVLSLAIDTYVGDTTQAITIKIYELDESMSVDSTYFTNRRLNVKPTPLASYSYLPRPKSRVSASEPLLAGGDTMIEYQPIIRIPLSAELAQRVLAASGTADLANNANFLNFFKGIAITAEVAGAQPGIMLNIIPRSVLNGMFLYYRNDTIRRRFDMVGRGDIAYFNSFRFDYTGTPLATAIGNTSPLIEENYVQAGTGVKIRVDFPYLKKLIENFDVAINKADLVFTVVPGSNTDLAPAPTRMFLLPSDSLNANLPNAMPDLLERYYGGALEDGKYTFGITRYVQLQLASTRPDYGLRLIPLNTVSTVNRAIIASSNHTNPLYRPRLILTFTKLK